TRSLRDWSSDVCSSDLGGGAANVARNWANGVPCEWGELGWAALDVADAALLVASLGSSATVTESGKEALKVTAKKVIRNTQTKRSEERRVGKERGTRRA